MYYKIVFSCISHIGNVRKINQDNFICNGHYMNLYDFDINFPQNGYVTNKTPTLFGVFDGMGGEECGEVASYIAARNASIKAFNSNSVYDLVEYCRQANFAICEYAENNSVSAMGTTAAIMLFSKKEITLCNIGDSKIFRFSGGKLEQISKDHIMISAFGTKPPLSQNLGIPPTEMLIEPYISQGSYKNGDRYLICSDGLTDMLPLCVIQDVLNNYPLKDSTEVLLNTALENGGKDNITIILIEIRQIKNNIFKIFNRDNGGESL